MSFLCQGCALFPLPCLLVLLMCPRPCANPHSPSAASTHLVCTPGIDVCGARVVKMVLDKIQQLQVQGQQVTKLSFIGYSLGGLILRYMRPRTRHTHHMNCLNCTTDFKVQSTGDCNCTTDVKVQSTGDCWSTQQALASALNNTLHQSHSPTQQASSHTVKHMQDKCRALQLMLVCLSVFE